MEEEIKQEVLEQEEKPKHAGGRPLEYNDEILKKTNEYIDSCEDENIRLVKQANEEKGYEMYENKLKVNLPSIEGLARYLKISRDTLYEWEKRFPEFSDIIGELRQKQAERLINNGLSGDYNSTIAKVLLTKHGYKEGIESEVTNLPIPLDDIQKDNSVSKNKEPDPED